MIPKNATEVWRVLNVTFREKYSVRRSIQGGCELACRGHGDEAPGRARHALLIWHAAAPPSLRWQRSQHSPGVVYARRKVACRAAYKGARRCLPECRTPPHLQLALAAFEDSVNIPEGEDIATGAPAGILCSSTHCGAADNHWGYASSLETRRYT